MNSEITLKLAAVWRVLSWSRYHIVITLKSLEAGAFDPLTKTFTTGEQIATRKEQAKYEKLSTPLRELQQGES